MNKMDEYFVLGTPDGREGLNGQYHKYTHNKKKKKKNVKGKPDN